jgi:exosortase K
MNSTTYIKLARTVPVILIAGAVKAWYSTAGADDLLWLLAPTSRIAGVLTGEAFHYEDYMGYVNSDHSFLIAVPCAGVNFLITAFLLIALLRLWSGGGRNSIVHVIGFAAVGAYLATIIANSLRIAVALLLLRSHLTFAWATPEQVHRLEGIFVYFGCLLLLFALCRPAAEGRRGRWPLAVWAGFPLAIYWSVTLGVPLLNGAYTQGNGFWEHALFVLLTPTILILPPALYRYFSTRERAQAL